MKLRTILRQLKSDNPQKRYEALNSLYTYKQMEGIEIQVDVLKDMIKAAASAFPERVDHWDNPSFFLIDFVCDFPMPEIVEGLMKNFDGFDVDAKERAIEFLLNTEEEEIFYFLEEKIVELIRNNDSFQIPYEELSSYPMLIKGILDHTLDLLPSPHYKFMLYDLVLSFNQSGFENGYKKDIILPSLLKDYQSVKNEYLKYDREYITKFVYTAWKSTYLVIRNRMKLLISLMEYYFNQEVADELTQALNFKDPMIKTEALIICIGKNLPYHENLLKECALQIESAEMFYWKLREKNLDHLYPLPEGKQPHLATSRLFSTIINLPEEENGIIYFPEDIKIIDQIETENTYGQPVRYYLLSFRIDNRIYAGWAGGYALEDGSDTANLWDGSYTDLIEFHSASIEGHKEQFFLKRAEETQEYENTIHYESSPKLSKGAWFFIALLITHWIRMALSGFEGPIWPSFFFTFIGGGLCFIETLKNKKRKISIIGHQLIKIEGSKENSIRIEEIRRIEYNKKHVLIYNDKNELALKFPLRWVRYELFFVHMKEQTAHLKNVPFIQP